MTTAQPNFRRPTIWPFLLAATITACSGFPAAVPEMGWIEPDKLGHFAAYGALATAICRHPAMARWPGLGAWWAFPLAAAYGLGDEFRQYFGGVRMFELADWVADMIGAGVATILYLRWTSYRRLLETRIGRPHRPVGKAVPNAASVAGAAVATGTGHSLASGEQND